MGTAKHVGALAVALGVGNVRRTATRITVSVGAAAVVMMATVVPASTASASGLGSDESPPDKTALILCGTTCPTPDEFWIESIKNQFIAPTHPGKDIDYVGVTAPMEFWPITGLFRVVLFAVGPPELWGPGGPGWPDEPLWKLSGLFDLTADQSLKAGVANLEAAMAANGNDHLVIFGNSQGAGIANAVKRGLAEQYPAGNTAPDIDFVLGGDPNLPNGGLLSRFPGLYIPIVNLTFNGPAATDTQFKTVEINRQYDGFSDFPLYPLNVVADVNAVLGVLYVHAYGLDVSMAPGAPTAPAFQGTHGDTSYYFFETPDLPLFGPLRTLGVPEPVIDVFEPFFRVLVELGYDRSIKPWEPTPARLIPPLDPGKVITDLVLAIGEGINNALALVGLPPLLHATAPVARAAPPTETATADISRQLMSKDTPTQTGQAMSTEPAADTEQTSTDIPTPTTDLAQLPETDVTTTEPAADTEQTSTDIPTPTTDLAKLPETDDVPKEPQTTDQQPSTTDETENAEADDDDVDQPTPAADPAPSDSTSGDDSPADAGAESESE
ncbi:MAG TPA: PE-PPE domain-containing protein [Mycobacterium sp.]|nr:PE-PPE domain-containing protein [Mycobacterium sp.]